MTTQAQIKQNLKTKYPVEENKYWQNYCELKELNIYKYKYLIKIFDTVYVLLKISKRSI